MSTATERLSYSRFSKYISCRRAYRYQYIEKLYPIGGTISVEKWMDRQRGTVVHAIMEALLLGRTAEQGAEAGFEECVRGKYGREDASLDKQQALRDYLPELLEIGKRTGEFMRVEEWEPLMLKGKPIIEAEVSLPIQGWKDFYGKIDFAAVHKPSGLRFVLDFKTTTRFDDVRKEDYRLQMILYSKMLRENGVEVAGSGIFQIKPELPKRAPRKLRIDEGAFDQVRESEDGKFRFLPSIYGETYQDNVWREFERAAIEMSKFTEASDLVNLNPFQCDFCDLRKLCQAELRGEDADYIRDTCYTPSKTRPKSLLTVDF